MQDEVNQRDVIRYGRVRHVTDGSHDWSNIAVVLCRQMLLVCLGDQELILLQMLLFYIFCTSVSECGMRKYKNNAKGFIILKI